VTRASRPSRPEATNLSDESTVTHRMCGSGAPSSRRCHILPQCDTAGFGAYQLKEGSIGWRLPYRIACECVWAVGSAAARAPRHDLLGSRNGSKSLTTSRARTSGGSRLIGSDYLFMRIAEAGGFEVNSVVVRKDACEVLE
jgi:hypothetical protein